MCLSDDFFYNFVSNEMMYLFEWIFCFIKFDNNVINFFFYLFVGVIVLIFIGFVVLVDYLVGVFYMGVFMNFVRSFGFVLVSGYWGCFYIIYWFGFCFGVFLVLVIYRYLD